MSRSAGSHGTAPGPSLIFAAELPQRRPVARRGRNQARVTLRHRRRDKELKIDTAKKRADRQELLPLAHPQRGVDALKFSNIQPIKGVLDKDAAP